MASMNFILGIAICLIGASAQVEAQSVDQSAPTKIPGAEVISTVIPRPEGDPRLTTHFFSLDVRQGDLYLNVVHRNFVGDVDVFSIDARRPLGKLTVVESVVEREIGRVLFIRNSGQVLIRVEGRTLNNDEAVYRLKFGGSALVGRATASALDLRSSHIQQALPKESPGQNETSGFTETMIPSASLRITEKKMSLRIEFDDGGKVERPMSSVSRVTIEKDQLVVVLVNGSESRYPASSVIRFSVD